MTGIRAWIPASGGLSALGETEVRSLLSRIEPRVHEAHDRTATGLLTIVEQTAAQWFDRIAAIDRAWEAHEMAVADEERTRKGLVAVLRTLIELVGVPAQEDPGMDREGVAVADQHLSPTHHPPARTGDCVDPALPPGARGAELAACLLGPFCLLRRGRPLEEWHGSKTSRVLRFLIAHRGRSVPRDALIDVFWPDTDAESGRRNVHQMIYTIRKSLRGAASADDGSEPPLILFENDAYALNVQVGFWCDATEFERHVTAGRRAEAEGRIDEATTHYAQAQHLYRGRATSSRSDSSPARR